MLPCVHMHGKCVAMNASVHVLSCACICMVRQSVMLLLQVGCHVYIYIHGKTKCAVMSASVLPCVHIHGKTKCVVMIMSNIYE